MIDREHKLSVVRQARLLGFSRCSVCYSPRPVSDDDLALMRRIDELHLEYPFAGSRMLQGLLKGEGLETGRLHGRYADEEDGHRGDLSSPEHVKTSARAQNLSLPPAQAGGHQAQPGLGNGHNVCADGATMSSSKGSGDRSDTKRSTSTPTGPCPRPARQSVGI
jgi:hypothetical protein